MSRLRDYIEQIRAEQPNPEDRVFRFTNIEGNQRPGFEQPYQQGAPASGTTYGGFEGYTYDPSTGTAMQESAIKPEQEMLDSMIDFSGDPHDKAAIQASKMLPALANMAGVDPRSGKMSEAQRKMIQDKLLNEIYPALVQRYQTHQVNKARQKFFGLEPEAYQKIYDKVAARLDKRYGGNYEQMPEDERHQMIHSQVGRIVQGGGQGQMPMQSQPGGDPGAVPIEGGMEDTVLRPGDDTSVRPIPPGDPNRPAQMQPMGIQNAPPPNSVYKGRVVESYAVDRQGNLYVKFQDGGNAKVE